MEWYGMIKRYYDGNYWTKEQVSQAVVLDKITSTQYEQIIGEPYEL
jgi:uncharacterized XkdX family phage protein